MNEYDHFNQIVENKIKETIERKEEILTAFVAKYEIQPNKIVQIYQDNTCYLVDIDNTHLCNSGKCYDLRNQLTSQIAKYQEKENKKNECDHIVGYFRDRVDGNPIMLTINSRHYKHYPEDIDIRFNFCPECGEKLNDK